MTWRVRYSAEEARRVIMSLPDDDKSDYPDFLGDFAGENVDLELGDTSDSDSDGSEPNQVPNPGSDCGTREGGDMVLKVYMHI